MNRDKINDKYKWDLEVIYSSKEDFYKDWEANRWGIQDYRRTDFWEHHKHNRKRGASEELRD